MDDDDMQTTSRLDSIDFIEMFTLDASNFLNIANTDSEKLSIASASSEALASCQNNDSTTNETLLNTNSPDEKATTCSQTDLQFATGPEPTESLDLKHQNAENFSNFPLSTCVDFFATAPSSNSSSSTKLPLVLPSSHGKLCASPPHTLIDDNNKPPLRQHIDGNDNDDDDDEPCAQPLFCNHHNSTDPDVQELNNGISNVSEQDLELDSSDQLVNRTRPYNPVNSILLEIEKELDVKTSDFVTNSSELNRECVANHLQLENNDEREKSKFLFTQSACESDSTSRTTAQVSDCLDHNHLISQIKNDKFATDIDKWNLGKQPYCNQQKLTQKDKVRVFIISPESIIQCKVCKEHILYDNFDCKTKDETNVCCSKHLNRKIKNSKSRLKSLQARLKSAGLTDCSNHHQSIQSEKCTKVSSCSNNNSFSSHDKQFIDGTSQLVVVDNDDKDDKDNGIDVNHNKLLTECVPPKEFSDQPSPSTGSSIYTNYSTFNNANDELISLDSNQEKNTFEEIIPRTCAEFSQFNANDFNSLIIREPVKSHDSLSPEHSCSSEDNKEDYYFIITRKINNNSVMVKETGKSQQQQQQQNTNKDNLKSLLKKPGRTKKKKSNRVVFNETKNEFFDADYIILIREECDFEEDDDDSVCTCNQHEMVRLPCCDTNCCNCQMYDQMPPSNSPKYAPPIEFVDTVTLSPPEGYKDMELMGDPRAQQQQQQQQQSEICFECNAGYEEEEEDECDEQDVSQSDSEIEGDGVGKKEQESETKDRETTDQSQQTTPTTPPNSEISTFPHQHHQHQQIAHEIETDYNRTSPSFALNQKYQSTNSTVNGILKGGKLWKQQSQQSVDVASPMKISREPNVNTPLDLVSSDDETGNKRSVHFIESNEEIERRDGGCDGAAVDMSPEEESLTISIDSNDTVASNAQKQNKQGHNDNSPPSPAASPEMILTFKLGNHVLISNNSLKPNSAVRQLFPCTKSLVNSQGLSGEDNPQKYLVTAESLRAFEEAKRSKLPQIIQRGETDETIKKAIERNTLRRSLIRYDESRTKQRAYKSDDSLVERIKQLTCNVDDNTPYQTEQRRIQEQSPKLSSEDSDVPSSRSSPPGEESREPTDINVVASSNNMVEKSFSPSSSSTASSNSTSLSMNSLYRQAINSNQNQHQNCQKPVELPLGVDIAKIENLPDIQNNLKKDTKHFPDIGNNPSIARGMLNQMPDLSQYPNPNKMDTTTATAITEARRQFLSSLAPLTACVTMRITHSEDSYYHLSNNMLDYPTSSEASATSSGTAEYSLEDIEEGLKHDNIEEQPKRIAPDVLAGTPSASESGDELAMFVQQDAGRMEKIKKKYHMSENQQNKGTAKDEEDDENDDYGFNKRPSVQGIKTRFNPETNELLQQFQTRLQPPSAVAPTAPTREPRPYYYESGIIEVPRPKNVNQNVAVNYHYNNIPDGINYKTYGVSQHRSPSYLGNNSYSNCSNQQCILKQESYARNNMNVYSSMVRVNDDCYQTLPVSTRHRNHRPQSPPPMDMSRQYQQTMFYIPYNHIEGCQQPTQYVDQTVSASEYVSRVSNQNQINARYAEPIYHARPPPHSSDEFHQDHHHHHDHQYNIPAKPAKYFGRSQNHIQHIVLNRSNSPVKAHSTARSTQTPPSNTMNCGYYPVNSGCRPGVWQSDDGNYVQKINHHRFPLIDSRYQPADSISLTDSDSQHSGSLPNGYIPSLADLLIYNSKDSTTSSPTRSRYNERGVPEGAASVSPQDLSAQSSYSTITSPTSPQNPLPSTSSNSTLPNSQKPLVYTMNI